MSPPSFLGLEQISVCRDRIGSVLRHPKLVPLPLDDCVSAKRIWAFDEFLQVSGSYKVRAALHLVHCWQEQYRHRYPAGVALSSSGNFAAALAWAGQQAQVPTAVVMMTKSSGFKARKAEDWGARVVRCGDHLDERLQTLANLEQEGYWCVNHLDSPEVLTAHATLGLDLSGLLKPGQPVRVIVPVSTAGLLAAVAACLFQSNPGSEVWGCQSSTSNAAQLSFEAGQMVSVFAPTTVCDALTSNRPGRLPLDLCLAYCQGIVSAPDQQILAAQQQLHALGLAVEPGAAVPMAVLDRLPASSLDIVLVLTGGNFSPPT